MKRTLASLLLCSTPAMAEVPRVVTDILPVHSLVSMIMDGVGTPEVLVSGTASPHSFSLRPSQAAALQDAGLVVWIGPELTPWLGEPLSTLATNATLIALLDHPDTHILETRDMEALEAADDHDEHGEEDHDEHDHDSHDEDEHDEHGHDDHDDHEDDHDEHGHEDHDDAHDEHHEDDHDGHDHGPLDPHAWLDPHNAESWLTRIANQLAELDPANSAAYMANLAEATERLEVLEGEIEATLSGFGSAEYLVFHDAYQYFEEAFGVRAHAALAISDATPPGPAHMRHLQEIVAEHGIQCAFTEPQYDPRLLETVLEGSSARLAQLDPIGITGEPGPNQYPDMMIAMAQSMANCLSGGEN